MAFFYHIYLFAKGLVRKGIKRPYFNFLVISKAKRVGKNLKVNGRSSVTNNTILGDNVNFNGMVIQGTGMVTIGNNFHSGVDSLMITDNHNFDHGKSIPYDNTVITKDISIADNVWLGSRVIILGGAVIEEGAIIQAGSVVINKIPKYGIAGGNPAKVFKYRDREHYEKLKKEAKFF